MNRGWTSANATRRKLIVLRRSVDLQLRIITSSGNAVSSRAAARQSLALIPFASMAMSGAARVAAAISRSRTRIVSGMVSLRAWVRASNHA